jgi:hypothetical protein
MRALSVALLATAFSAGLAFADQASTPPEAAAGGLAIAELASGKDVPVRASDEDAADEAEPEDEETDEEEEAEEETVEEESEDGDNCSTDPTTLTEEELAEMRHGSIVCWAAKQETPEGYDNHGQWVSEWARSNGHPEADETDEGDDEADEGDEAEPAAAQQVRGKGKGKGHGGRPF